MARRFKQAHRTEAKRTQAGLVVPVFDGPTFVESPRGRTERENMNKQEIFNKAYLGLRDQGFEQSEQDGECRFKGPRGQRCALGHCLTDEQLEVADHKGTYWVMGQIAPGSPRLRDFLGDLQLVHDDNPYFMRAALERFAAARGLAVPE